MSSVIRRVPTRFRAYQIGVPGASFSYFADGHFTLIEAIATDLNKAQIRAELAACGKRTIDTLHITSWDQDHCSVSGVEWILLHLAPSHIECPGYAPHTDCGRTCQSIIANYRMKWSGNGHAVTVQPIDPPYIATLEAAKALGYSNVIYHPKQLHPHPNNNSTVKFFRSGSFTVLSLGDVEDPSIGALLRRCRTLCREVDVMILAHHGADNGFTTKRLLEDMSPTLAICGADYDNKFEHPHQEIRALLHDQDIPLFTTKTGDVVVQSVGWHTMDYEVTNLCSDSTKISSTRPFRSRKSALLRLGADTVRNVLHPGYAGRH